MSSKTLTNSVKSDISMAIDDDPVSYRQKQISVREIAVVEDVKQIKSGFNRHLHYTLIKDRNIATKRDYYLALANCIRDHLASRWIRTNQYHNEKDPKRIYYLSLEYNMGRSLQNTMISLGIDDSCDYAMYQLGLDIEELEQLESDIDFSISGFGRVAACFLDSMATIGVAAYGYGIRYSYGAFAQKIVKGEQVEVLDDWLRFGNPWETSRPEFIFPVHFYGRVSDTVTGGRQWIDTQVLFAMPYDYPIPGYQNNIVNTLRLWAAKAPTEFDLKHFNGGEYIQAILDRTLAENISCLMYPTSRNAPENREIRLKQEYFLCAASLCDIIRRFKASKAFRLNNCQPDFQSFPKMNAIHLNDSPSTLAIPELMRILIDIEGLSWDDAWKITVKTFSITIHSNFPDALEQWPISMLEKLLPRHSEIILQINYHNLDRAKILNSIGGDQTFGLSLISGNDMRHIDMIKLGIIGSHAVTGVSSMQSKNMQLQTFKDLYEFEPNKFLNLSNGVSPRRWLLQCNPGLSDIISDSIGENWTRHMEKLVIFNKYSKTQTYQSLIAKAKQESKVKVSKYIEKVSGLTIDPSSLFDVQAQCINESKRQLLNCLHIITLFNRLKLEPNFLITPRTFIFSGKVEPGNYFGKKMIKLINAIAGYVNNDPIIGEKMKVVFVENYGVTLAELLIPCVDLSEQISLAGSGASGVSSIKMMMNGALTICTRDGILNEIIEMVGNDNIFTFGLNVNEIQNIRTKPFNSNDILNRNAELKKCIEQIRSGYFCPQNPNEFKEIMDDVLKNDEYFVLSDYEDYVRVQKSVAETFDNESKWYEMVIENIAASGKFSIDQTIIEYAKIWDVEADYKVLPSPSDA